MSENGYLGRKPNDTSTVIARQQFAVTTPTTEFEFRTGYDTGYVDVYLNGVRLLEGRDFSAGDGQKVILNVPAQENDILEVVAYKAFSPTAVQNADINIEARIGIQSAGQLVGVTTTLNFVGAGNSVEVNGGVIDISIAGSSGGSDGGALGERLSNDETSPKYKIYKQKKLLDMTEDVILDPAEVGSDYDHVAYIAEADVRVAVGNTFQIGLGITFRPNILGIFPQ